jgi:serine/threonine protein kinase
MGTVFLGRDPDGRMVAVKAIKPAYAGDDEFRARFRSEVSRAREVPSFCTAAVLAADPDSATPYLVVEYVDGPSLQEMVYEQGPMSPGDLHGVAVGVAAALTAIHGAGVIHRDLKPANVLLSVGLPKVIDFGIARALEGTTQHTRPGRYVGTVDYMAPERLDSSLGAVTPAADIFAWGAVIAFAGTGRVPYRGDNPVAVAAQILTKAPDLRGLPASLAELVAAALDRDPHRRPTANELLQRLLVVDTPAPDSRGRRFDARDLLEQVVAERPAAARFSAAAPSRPRSSAAAPSRPRSSAAAPSRPRLSAAAPRPRRTTPRRLLYAVLAMVLASATGVTLAYAQNIDDKPTSATTELQPASVPVSAKPRGPSFSDPLREPGRFQESSGDAGRCTFRNARLHAQADGRSSYRCTGPSDTFPGDQTISVDLALAGNGACAMIWFRHRDAGGYQLTACPGVLELEELSGAVLTSIGRNSSVVLTPGTSHDLSIVITGGHATVLVDDSPAVQAAVSDAAGRVEIGVANSGKSETAEASFADFEVRTN